MVCELYLNKVSKKWEGEHLSNRLYHYYPNREKNEMRKTQVRWDKIQNKMAEINPNVSKINESRF